MNAHETMDRRSPAGARRRPARGRRSPAKPTAGTAAWNARSTSVSAALSAATVTREDRGGLAADALRDAARR